MAAAADAHADILGGGTCAPTAVGLVDSGSTSADAADFHAHGADAGVGALLRGALVVLERTKMLIQSLLLHKLPLLLQQLKHMPILLLLMLPHLL